MYLLKKRQRCKCFRILTKSYKRFFNTFFACENACKWALICESRYNNADKDKMVCVEEAKAWAIITCFVSVSQRSLYLFRLSSPSRSLSRPMMSEPCWPQPCLRLHCQPATNPRSSVCQLLVVWRPLTSPPALVPPLSHPPQAPSHRTANCLSCWGRQGPRDLWEWRKPRMVSVS